MNHRETAATPLRHVLTGIPRVGFYPDMRELEPERGPEDILKVRTKRPSVSTTTR